MKTVVCLGDSLTDVQVFGYSWTTVLDDYFDNLNFVNSGHFGGLTTDFLLSDKKTVDWIKLHNAVMRFDPSIVLITLGGNDLVITTDQTRDIFNRYKAIVNYMRNANIHVVMGLYELTKEQCDGIYDGGCHNYSKLMFKMRFTSYSTLIRTFGNGWRVKEPIISLYKGITTNNKIPPEYLRDPVHLSELGANQVGLYLVDTLRDYFNAVALEG